MIEDGALQEKIMRKISKLRILIDAVGDYEIRRALDQRLTEAFLLARDGCLRNLNGGSNEKL